tara:strand:+ start:195 stop:398 length:204 start_codon:yes stop_codon:yes gene_type:complete
VFAFYVVARAIKAIEKEKEAADMKKRAREEGDEPPDDDAKKAKEEPEEEPKKQLGERAMLGPAQTEM